MVKHSLVLILAVLLALPAMTLRAQNCTSPSWEGRFYNNTDFSDSPVLQSCSPVIDFDWGLSAPGAGVNIDDFAVRWTSTQTFPAAGSYLFTVTAQDGVRLFVNGTPLINVMEDVDQTQTLTAVYNVPTAGATAFITLEMVNFTGVGSLKLVWALTSGGVPEGAAPTTNTTTAPTVSGFTDSTDGEVVTVAATGGGEPWTVEYFNNLDGSDAPTVTETAPPDGISINYGLEAPADGLPTDGWSSRWTRSVDFPDGVYTFTLRADDGAKVSINDVQILDQPTFAAGASYTVAVQIPAGEHVIVVEHYDVQEAADLFLTWNPPVGTVLLPDGCNGATAGINGSAPPCPDQQAQPVVNLGTTTTSPNSNNPSLSVTVRAGPLYFRPSPNKTGEPYGFLHRGDTFTAIGRSADNIWIQLQANGQTGWSMTEFLTLAGDINTLAITDGTVAPSDPASVGTTSGTGVTVLEESNPNESTSEESTEQAISEPSFTGVRAQSLGNLRMRAAPNDDAERILSVPWGAIVDVVGRSSDGLWLQITLDGTQGWSAAAWYQVVQGDLNTVPITQ